VAVILNCTDETTFECLTMQSYADFLMAWFADAALEFENAPSVGSAQ
jgi:sarcosine oxidase gamma subunit